MALVQPRNKNFMQSTTNSSKFQEGDLEAHRPLRSVVQDADILDRKLQAIEQLINSDSSTKPYLIRHTLDILNKQIEELRAGVSSSTSHYRKLGEQLVESHGIGSSPKSNNMNSTTNNQKFQEGDLEVHRPLRSAVQVADNLDSKRPLATLNLTFEFLGTPEAPEHKCILEFRGHTFVSSARTKALAKSQCCAAALREFGEEVGSNPVGQLNELNQKDFVKSPSFVSKPEVVLDFSFDFIGTPEQPEHKCALTYDNSVFVASARTKSEAKTQCCIAALVALNVTVGNNPVGQMNELNQKRYSSNLRQVNTITPPKEEVVVPTTLAQEPHAYITDSDDEDEEEFGIRRLLLEPSVEFTAEDEFHVCSLEMDDIQVAGFGKRKQDAKADAYKKLLEILNFEPNSNPVGQYNELRQQQQSVNAKKPAKLDITKRTHRLKSFRCKELLDAAKQSFFLSDPHNIRRLAEAGFVYLGKDDMVYCHVCDTIFGKFEPDDDPWVEHARWSPKCGFLKQCWNSIPKKYMDKIVERGYDKPNYIPKMNPIEIDLTCCGDVESNPGPVLSKPSKNVNSYEKRRLKAGNWTPQQIVAASRLEERIVKKAKKIAQKIRAEERNNKSTAEMFSVAAGTAIGHLTTAGAAGVAAYATGKALKNRFQPEIEKHMETLQNTVSLTGDMVGRVADLLAKLVEWKEKALDSDTFAMFRNVAKGVSHAIYVFVVAYMVSKFIWKFWNYLGKDKNLLLQIILVVTGYKLTREVTKWILENAHPTWYWPRNVGYEDLSTAEMDVREINSDPADGMAMLVKLCIACLCIVSGKFVLTSDKLEKMARKVDVLSKGSLAISKLCGTKQGPLDAAVSWFKKALIGEELSDLDIEVREHIDEIVALHNKIGERTITTDKHLVRRIMELNARQNEFLHSHQYKKFLTKAHVQDLNQVGSLLFSLHKRALESNAESGGTRQEPFFMMLTGQPGCGKSFVTTHLAPVMLRLKYGENVLTADNLTQFVYNRCFETEYWDNYQGQEIVIYDDFGQVIDTVANPSVEFLEMIRAVNTSPMGVHSAALEDKGRYFNSDCIIATSNQDKQFGQIIQSVNDPVAVLRRLGSFVVRVKPNPKYIKGGDLGDQVSRDQVKAQEVLDPVKMRNCKECKLIPAGKRIPNFCVHAQFFTLYDIVTDEPITTFAGKEIGTNMLYGKFLRLVQLAYESHKKKIENQKSFQEKVFSDPLCVMDDDDFSTAEMYAMRLGREKTFNYNPSARKTNIRVDGEEEEVTVIDESDKVIDMVDAFIGYNNQEIIQPISLFSTLSTKSFDGYDLVQIFGNVSSTFVQVSQNTFELLKRKTDNFQKLIRRTVCTSFDVDSCVSLGCSYLIPISIYINSLCYGIRSKCVQGFNYLKYLATSTFDWIKNLKVFDMIKDAKQRVEEFMVNHPVLSAVLMCVSLVGVAVAGYSIFNKIFSDKEKHYPEAVIQNSSEQHKRVNRKVEQVVQNSGEQTKRVNRKVETVIQNSGEQKRVNNRKVESQTVQNSGEQKLKVKRQVESSLLLSKQVQLGAAGLSCVMGDILNHPLSQRARNAIEAFQKDPVDISVPEMITDPTLEALQTKLLTKNQCLVSDKDSVLTNLLFIHGTVCLLPRHFYETACHRERDYQYFVSSIQGENVASFSAGYVVDNSIFMVKEHGDTTYQGDVVMLFLDPCKTQAGVARPSLIDNFVKQSDLAAFNPGHTGLLHSLRNFSGYVTPFLRTAKMVNIGQELVDYDNDMFCAKYIDCKYISQTQAGDCMSPFLVDDIRFQNRRIFSLHTSSCSSKNKFTYNGQTVNIGEGWIITQEDLKRTMALLPGKEKIYVGETEAVMDASTVEMLLHGKKIGSITTRIGLEIQGRAKLGVRQETRSKIIPSQVYDTYRDYGFPKKMPATLKPITVDGVEINPMTLGTTKYAKIVPLLDYDLIKECVYDVANNFYTQYHGESPLPYQRVLTQIEMCEGNRDIGVEPLNRSTSMGYPYAQLHRGTNGKRGAFGLDEWTYDTPQAREILNDVEELERDCAEGIQRGVYWTDTLKDEKRPIEKVMKGKTRVFTAGPVHYTLLFRKYFGGFTGWIMRNHIHNEIAVGTNVYSKDWDDMARFLLRHLSSEQISLIAGDFENYDGSENAQILWLLFEVINDWYVNGYKKRCQQEGIPIDFNLIARETRIRRVLWSHIVNAVHINGDVIYQCTHSIPSGCPITAILNSEYGSSICRAAYKKIMLIVGKIHPEIQLADMESFRRYIRLVVYGDDNLISVHPDIEEWFNQETLTKAFAELGHVYTDEAKTGAVYEKRLLTDVAFLKRKFVYSSHAHRWIAPLDLDSVLETPLWTKDGTRADTITIANIENTLEELSLHGEEVYNHYGFMIVDKARDVGFQMNLLPWREVFEKQLQLEYF